MRSENTRTTRTGTGGFVFCIPVFNDWASARLLVEWLDRAVATMKIEASVLLVDDGSTDDIWSSLAQPLQALQKVEVLRLRRNVGHQRAIALGLTFVFAERTPRGVIVMDGDGEDSPDDVACLLERFEEQDEKRIIFAKRARRSEGLTFRLSYVLYKAVHRILTGRRVEVGNFSVIPLCLLSRLVAVSELWNHYAAAVYNSRLPFDMVPVPRANRLHGRSRMNFVALVTHGLSAISIFGSDVGVRLLAVTAGFMIATVAAMLTVFGIRAFTGLAIPGWATSAFGLLLVMLMNAVVLSLTYCFVILQSRASVGFLPLRDYRYYIMDDFEVSYDG